MKSILYLKVEIKDSESAQTPYKVKDGIFGGCGEAEHVFLSMECVLLLLKIVVESKTTRHSRLQSSLKKDKFPFWSKKGKMC